MVALWMIGFEDAPERSGEILVCEIFGRDMTGTTARVAMGVRRWADPALEDDVEQVPLEIDAREPHWYAAQWLPDRVAFYVDERLIRSVARAPTYPMQFMLSLYELADGPGLGSGLDRYPKVAVVERFRGWRPVTGDGARPPAFPLSRRPGVGSLHGGPSLDRAGRLDFGAIGRLRPRHDPRR